MYTPSEIKYQSDEIGELVTALSQFQGAYRGAEHNKEGVHNSKYADLHAIWSTVREPLKEYGLSLTHIPFQSEDKVILITLLSHKSGQWFRSVIPLSMHEKITETFKFGATITYMMRYILKAMLGISTADDIEDFDINTPLACEEVAAPAKKIDAMGEEASNDLKVLLRERGKEYQDKFKGILEKRYTNFEKMAFLPMKEYFALRKLIMAKPIELAEAVSKPAESITVPSKAIPLDEYSNDDDEAANG